MQVNKGNVKTTNNPAGGGSGAKKSSNMGMMMIAAAIVVVVVVVVVMMSGGKKQEVSTDTNVKQFNPSEATQVNGGGARVYEESKRTESTLGSQNQNAASAGQMPELEYYIDPVTGQEMVKTPNGPLLKNSPDGIQYIEDYERLRLEAGVKTTDNTASAGIPTEQYNQVMQEVDSKFQMLDEKVESQQDYIDQLTTLVKRQNETIKGMSEQVKTVQPIVKSSKELANEFFGKGGDKKLKSRNASIEALSIVGDKAWVINGFGKESLVRVGEVVPGTSTKIKQIDASNNVVIVAD
jgi:uncharacterized coiled-coil protein SlyX